MQKLYLPGELTCGSFIKQDAAIWQIIAKRAMASDLENLRRKYFFIIKSLNWLGITDLTGRNRFKMKRNFLIILT